MAAVLDRSPPPSISAHLDLHEVLRELKVRHPGGTHVAVAVDGSTISDRAAQIAGRFI